MWKSGTDEGSGRVAGPEGDVRKGSRRWAAAENRDAHFGWYGFSIGAHRRDEIWERKGGGKVEIGSEIAAGMTRTGGRQKEKATKWRTKSTPQRAQRDSQRTQPES
jgi:hypothetical protein